MVQFATAQTQLQLAIKTVQEDDAVLIRKQLEKQKSKSNFADSPEEHQKSEKNTKDEN
jgi:hypothetical protein